MRDKSFLIGYCSEELVFRNGKFALSVEGKRKECRITPREAERWYKQHCPRYSWKGILKEIQHYEGRTP